MKTKIIRHENGETEYRYSDQTGDTVLWKYPVFEGVELVFNSVHMSTCDLGAEAEGNLIEIHHCREGRLEHQYGDGNNLLYLMPGDLSLSRRSSKKDLCHFPLRHYHGLTVLIHEDIVPGCLSCLMKAVTVEPAALADRLCGREGCFIARKWEYTEHILSEMYSVPEAHKQGYFKLKVMELLFVLGWIDEKNNDISAVSLSHAQVQIAKKAAGYLSDRLDQHITQEELAGMLNVSRTYLCNAFRNVYGVPLYTYVRIAKIQKASLQLLHSDKTIAEIAGESGYDNPSKFSSAFKEIMGETPLEYRKNHWDAGNL